MDQLRTQDAIAVIRKRPRTFLKRASVRDLSVFLSGYCFGLDLAHPQDFPHGGDITLFRQWLMLRLEGTGEAEWASLLLAECNNDDEQAFDAFFLFWDEFLESSASQE